MHQSLFNTIFTNGERSFTRMGMFNCHLNWIFCRLSRFSKKSMVQQEGMLRTFILVKPLKFYHDQKKCE